MTLPRPTSSNVIFPLLSITLFLLSLYQLLYSSSHPNIDPPPSPTPSPPRTRQPNNLVVATLNLRYDGAWKETIPVGREGDGKDDVYAPGRREEGGDERPWSQRRFRIASMLAFHQPHIIGFQEALHSQVLDLATLLGPSFSHVGVGRDDGKTQGEYAPIFFDHDRYEQVEWQTVWLSADRKVGSVGWDASQPRIATLLTLRDKTSPSTSSSLVHISNTHWDDRGILARHESGKLLRDLIPEYAIRAEAKFFGPGDESKAVREEGGNEVEGQGGEEDGVQGLVMLIGDLNSPSEEQGYKALTSPTYISSSLLFSTTSNPTSPPFHDALHLLPPTSTPFGPFNTYTSFAPPPPTAPSAVESRIDFVFLHETSRADGWAVVRHGVLDNWLSGDGQGWVGRWSDHRAAVVEVSREESRGR